MIPIFGIRVLNADPQYHHHYLSSYYILTQFLFVVINFIICIPNLLRWKYPVGWVYIIIDPCYEENGRRLLRIKVGTSFSDEICYVRHRMREHRRTLGNRGVHFAFRTVWSHLTEIYLKNMLSNANGLTRVSPNGREHYKGSVNDVINIANDMFGVLDAWRRGVNHNILDSTPGLAIVNERINTIWYHCRHLIWYNHDKRYKTYLPQGLLPNQIQHVHDNVQVWIGNGGGDRERTTSLAQPAGQRPQDLLQSLRNSHANNNTTPEVNDSFSVAANIWLGQQDPVDIVASTPYSTGFVKPQYRNTTSPLIESYNNHHAVWACLDWLFLFVVLYTTFVYLGVYWFMGMIFLVRFITQGFSMWFSPST